MSVILEGKDRTTTTLMRVEVATTQYANVPTLNTRLKQLLEFNLITHHLEKKELRKEWYEITEKGRKVLTPYAFHPFVFRIQCDEYSQSF